MSLVRKSELMQIAKERISDQDVSHDFQHALRVLSNVEKIAKQEGGDHVGGDYYFDDYFWFKAFTDYQH